MLNLKILTDDISLELFNYSLTHYLNLSGIDYCKILEYRNHDSVRLSMIETAHISMESHLRFRNKLLNKNLGYWALKRENKIIGSISLTDYDNQQLSLVGGNFLAPSLIGSGIGVIANFLMHSIAFEKAHCNKLVSFVKVNNTNANRLNKFFGGVVVDTISKGNKQQEKYYKYEFLKELWFDKIKHNSKKAVNYVI